LHITIARGFLCAEMKFQELEIYIVMNR